MKYLLLLLTVVLTACQTHRTRQLSRRDSNMAQHATSTGHVEKAMELSIQRDWRQWLAGSTAMVILPAGPVSYHPTRGFEGEARAILTYSSQQGYASARRSHTAGQHESQSSAQRYTTEIQSRSREQESVTDRQPLAGFSFRWLAIALATGCLLMFVLRFYHRRRGHGKHARWN